jgi:hypothetical protein
VFGEIIKASSIKFMGWMHLPQMVKPWNLADVPSNPWLGCPGYAAPLLSSFGHGSMLQLLTYAREDDHEVGVIVHRVY